jgi:2-polyprenyl-3-methyl-5-hydroxy-6-metoxy-1,4-benzoquinol methylase
MLPRKTWCIISCLLAILTLPGWAQEAASDAKEEIPPGVTTYMGRRVAQTMHYLGAPWLIRQSREREEDCTTMMANMGLKPGMTVCDMGCGNGFMPNVY